MPPQPSYSNRYSPTGRRHHPRPTLPHQGGGLSSALCALIFLLAGAGCTPQVHLMHGDAKSAQVEYDGNDLAAATVVAKAHCARFEKVPHYLETALNIAWYDCVHP